MKTLIDNYTNGNLAEARRAAKRFTLANITRNLVDSLGYSARRAVLTAAWLKTGEGYQAACDAI